MFVGNKGNGKISRETDQRWDVPKDTDMRCDKSGDLQPATMCGDTYVWLSINRYEYRRRESQRIERGPGRKARIHRGIERDR